MARNAAGHGSDAKLTDETTERICVAIRQGATLESAAIYAGVPRSTFHDWLRRGRQPGARNPYKAFVAQIDEALAHFEVNAVAQIAKAGADGEWQASAWRLERRYPDRYGRRTRIEGDVRVTAAPVLDVSKLTLDELETLRRLLAKAAPDVDQVGNGQKPALELLPGTGT